MNNCIQTVPPLTTDSVCGECCTKLTNVSVTIQGVTILDSINLHIHCGQLAVIIGPNGAGKTTLLRAMLGEVASRGTIQFRPSSIKQNQKFRIGYVPQHLDFDQSSPLSVLDLFAVTLSKRPLWLGTSKTLTKETQKSLESVDAASLLKQRISTLSGGQLQRVLLALALTPVPDLLLLDEPVSGVDPSGIELFYKKVSNLRKNLHLGIVMVSHDISSIAKHADRILFLNKTIISDDKPEHVLKQPYVIQIFGAQQTVNESTKPDKKAPVE